MTTRHFADWSPASVFGWTNNNGQEQAPPSVLKGAVSSVSIQRLENDNSGPEIETLSITAADAARVLQRRLRVWLLYRRELESIAQVQQLRYELEHAAAQAISDWLARCRVRRRLLARAAAYRRQQAMRRMLRGWMSSCVHRRRCRRHLWKRIHARRRIFCWWRCVKLRRRHRELKRFQFTEQAIQSFMRTRAAKAIGRFLTASVARKKAASVFCRFAHGKIRCRRAALDLNLRRRRRRGAISLEAVIGRWIRRHRLYEWATAIENLRESEQRRLHRAACVLQRLFRVTLTAFRLMRRRDAATCLQRVVRGKQARVRCRRLTHQRRAEAATKIQRIARGRLARKTFSKLLQQLRERFKCLNCGLIEPGGLYCKFCGRRRTTFDLLVSRVAAASSTTEAKLRRRRKRPDCNGRGAELPPAPVSVRRKGPPHRSESTVSSAAPVTNVVLPKLKGLDPSPSKTTKAFPALAIPTTIGSNPLSPIPPSKPREPIGQRAASCRSSGFHRALSLGDPNRTAGLTSVEKTQQRADTLMRQDASACASSGAMNLHLQRLHKAGKAASR